MDTEHFCEVKSFNELYLLIKSDFEYGSYIDGPGSFSGYSDAARLTYVRIRRSVLAGNPSLNIPNVPQSADAVTIMDCCTDAQIIIKISALPNPTEQSTTTPLSKEMPKESKKTDFAKLKTAETEQKAPINVTISGNVKAENLQIGHDAIIHKQGITNEEKKGIIGKLLEIIGFIIPLIRKILWPK